MTRMAGFAGGLLQRHDPWWDLEGAGARRRRRTMLGLRMVLTSLSIVVTGLCVAMSWLMLDTYGVPARIIQALG